MATQRRDIDFDALPPLIPRGSSRESIIEYLALKWATPIDDDNAPYTLEEVALIDENTNLPINLVDLLDAANKHISEAENTHASSPRPSTQRPQFQIQIHRCRVDLCVFKPDWCTHTHVSCDDCRFTSSLECKNSKFDNGASFNRAEFTGDAWFTGAEFTGDAWFDGAEFTGAAWFTGAEFTGDARFDGAEFTWAARFDGAEFTGDARFTGAEFTGDAWFDGAEFTGDARFNQAEFIGDAWFTGAEFTGDAWFDGATLEHQVYFNDAWFSNNTIYARSSLHAARFSSNSRNSARFGRRYPRRRHRRFWHQFVTLGAARLQWGSVRGFGELSILTRVSTSALVLVPILAAVWPSIRAGVEWYAQQRGYDTSLSPDLPWGWGFLFFAALFVLIGRAIYQSKCPQEVRERSRADVINDETDEFRTTRETEGDRRLSEAINAIEEAGTHTLLRWFRHPNLVTNRDGRTVWIPSRLEDFKYDREDVPDSWKNTSTNDEENDETETEREAKPRLLAEAVMSQVAREDIAIRAGADARYDIIARQNRQWARAALWCYTLAVILVGIVIWKQGVDILREMGWAWLTLENASQVTAWACWSIVAMLVLNLLLNTFVERPFDRLRRRFTRKPD